MCAQEVGLIGLLSSSNIQDSLVVFFFSLQNVLNHLQYIYCMSVTKLSDFKHLHSQQDTVSQKDIQIEIVINK